MNPSADHQGRGTAAERVNVCIYAFTSSASELIDKTVRVTQQLLSSTYKQPTPLISSFIDSQYYTPEIANWPLGQGLDTVLGLLTG